MASQKIVTLRLDGGLTGKLDKLARATGLLARNPAMGRPGRVPGTRELVIPNTPYILPYRVRANAVEILRVFPATRKWPTHF